jgi:hypothetical protein
MSGTKQQSNIRDKASIKHQGQSNNQTSGTKQQSNVRDKATIKRQEQSHDKHRKENVTITKEKPF